MAKEKHPVEGYVATKAELARRLEITRPTLDKYLYLEGAPKLTKDGYSVEEVAGFIGKMKNEKHTTGKTHWEAEKARLQCQKIEHELAVERGKYVELSDVAKVIVPIMSELGQLMKQEFELVNPSRYQGKDRVECAEINAKSIDTIIRRFRSGVKDLVATP